MSNLRRYENAPIKQRQAPLAEPEQEPAKAFRTENRPRVTESIWDPLPEPPRTERLPHEPRRDPEDDLRAAKAQVRKSHSLNAVVEWFGLLLLAMFLIFGSYVAGFEQCLYSHGKYLFSL